MNEEDGTKLEEFRQFRREVRGSSDYLLVGIDIAKGKHSYPPYTHPPISRGDLISEGCHISSWMRIFFPHSSH